MFCFAIIHHFRHPWRHELLKCIPTSFKSSAADFVQLNQPICEQSKATFATNRKFVFFQKMVHMLIGMKNILQRDNSPTTKTFGIQHKQFNLSYS